MKFVSVLSALTLVGSVYAASLNPPPAQETQARPTEPVDALLSKILAASGQALAETDKITGEQPLFKAVQEDLLKLLSQKNVDKEAIDEFTSKIPKMDDFRNFLQDGQFKKILNNDVVKNILSGNVDSLPEVEPIHDLIDGMVADLFNIEKENAAANRKAVFEKIRDAVADGEEIDLEL